jgi:hypothetical protein
MCVSQIKDITITSRSSGYGREGCSAANLYRPGLSLSSKKTCHKLQIIQQETKSLSSKHSYTRMDPVEIANQIIQKIAM